MATTRHIFTGINAAPRALGRSERLIAAPRRAGLRGEYLFGRDTATSAFNLAGGQPLAFVGAPEFSPRYARFSQIAWADTGLFDTPEATLLVVSAEPTASAPLITTFDGTNGGDATAFNVSGGNLQAYSVAADASVQTAQTAARVPLVEWTVKAMRISGGAAYSIVIDEYRQGARVGGVVVATGKARKPCASAPFAIGSSRGSDGFKGDVFIAGAAIWSRGLSDAEVLAEAAAISAKMQAWPQQSVVC